MWIVRRRKGCEPTICTIKPCRILRKIGLPRRGHRVNNIGGIRDYMLQRSKISKLVLRVLCRNRDRCGMSNICMQFRQWNMWHRMMRIRLWSMRMWWETGPCKLISLKMRWIKGIIFLLRWRRMKSIWLNHIPERPPLRPQLDLLH